jgi:alpha-mannosidase
MSHRELLLLSPHPLPTGHTLYLSDGEVAAFLHGHAVLWHPAVLSLAQSPPRIASPYDHDPPRPKAVYALAEACSSVLADDWHKRAQEAGCIVLKPAPTRADALADLLTQLRQLPPDQAPASHLLDLDPDRVAPFLGLGFGLLHIDGLFEAMSHDNLLPRDEFWGSVQAAIAELPSEDRTAFRRPLESAANNLLYAREVLYPSSLYLLDLALLDETNTAAPFPASFDLGTPLSILTTGAALERLAREHPDRLSALRDRASADLVEICIGGFQEREDALLPLESQLWNLRRGMETARELLGVEPRVHARKRFGFHPYLPGLLGSVGLTRTTLFTLDDSVLPLHRTPVVNWPSLDGRQIEAFTRTPQNAGSAQVFFHFTYILHQTMTQDLSATLPLLHKGEPSAPGYTDLLELSKLGPVLGRWVSLSGYLNEVLATDYTPPSEADEFADNYLLDRAPASDTSTVATSPTPPITGLAAHHRQRRSLDATSTVLAMAHGLGIPLESNGEALLPKLRALEDDLERGKLDSGALENLRQQACALLANRLVSRGPKQPGYLLLNPCSFTRRVVVDLPGCTDLLPVEGPVKACQVDGGSARAVVEIPALGFAWIPAQGQRGLAPNPKRLKLADDRAIRNEFFEAEIDLVTGGLRAVRDHRSRTNRLGQQLVFQPGSTMRADKVEVLSTGPALGELATEGVLLDANQQVLARFRQRFLTWIGRPMLEMHITIEPVAPPMGYAWHAYYGARFAAKEERTPLIRGVCEVPSLGFHHRPQSPDYLEFRTGQQNAVIFPQGLPFHQRQGNRMLDVLLICPGETATHFELGLSLDRPSPMQTAQGLLTPVLSVPTEQGPPHIGTTGWLFHIDAPNLLLTSLRPRAAEGDSRVLLARLHEIGGHPGQAELHCVRNPQRARLVDGRGNPLLDLSPSGDAVPFEFARHDLVQVEVVL